MSLNLQILAIEDAQDFQHLIGASLGNDHHCVPAYTLAEASRLLGDRNFDIILLDVNMPDGDGFKYFAELQRHEETREIPVIFITGRTEISDKVIGFSLGAEDYIVKPFDPQELRVRVESRVRKLRARRNKDLTLKRGNLKLVVALQRALLDESGKERPLNLTPLEFKLLLHLARHEDHVFSREQLIESVWKKNKDEIFDRTVDMHVSNLRRKLGHCDYAIQSVHGVGYRFTRGAHPLPPNQNN